MNRRGSGERGSGERGGGKRGGVVEVEGSGGKGLGHLLCMKPWVPKSISSLLMQHNLDQLSDLLL